MSLQTLYLNELNAMAKRRDPGFAAKLREVMVDRHPATLSPDEFDPVATVALAWQEVAPRGRSAFEDFAKATLDRMERAWVQGDANACDWSRAHAVCRLLRMVPAEIIDPGLRGRCVRKFGSLVVDRADFLAFGTGHHPAPNALWTDAFRLYLAWHSQNSKPSAWLEALWLAMLNDANWPPDEGACLLLEDAAAKNPDFITLPRLDDFWGVMHKRGAGVNDLRRWSYLVGAILEDTAAGQTRLDEILCNVSGHPRPKDNLPWDVFLEAVAAMFRKPEKRQRVLDLKSPPPGPASMASKNRPIDPVYKASVESIPLDLINCLLADV